MLAIESSHWSELHPFFGSPEDVPKAIAEWLRSIGFDQEDLVYSRDVFELFLHQATNSDVAYAIVPWLVEAATHRQSPLAFRYIADVGLVEMNRLAYGTHYPNCEPGEEPLDWLAADYRNAILTARVVAEDLLDRESRSGRRDMLWQTMPALWGNSKLAVRRWANGEPAPPR